VTPSITGVVSVIADPRSLRRVDPRRNLRNFHRTGELQFGISKRARNLHPDLHPVLRLEGSPKRRGVFPSFQPGQLIPEQNHDVQTIDLAVGFTATPLSPQLLGRISVGLVWGWLATCQESLQTINPLLEDRSVHFKHPLKGHKRPVGCFFIDFNNVHRCACGETLQAPTEMSQIDAVHGRAHADDW